MDFSMLRDSGRITTTTDDEAQACVWHEHATQMCSFDMAS